MVLIACQAAIGSEKVMCVCVADFWIPVLCTERQSLTIAIITMPLHIII